MQMKENQYNVDVCKRKEADELAGLFSLILRYEYAPYGFFTKLGVQGPTPVPFFGTFLGNIKVR